MPTPIAASTIMTQAFRFLEATPPSSFDDDSEQAQAAAEQYPVALRQCLEAADWSFASTLVFLPLAELPLTVAADPDLPYLYNLPGNLVRIHEVGDNFTRWRKDAAGLRADDTAPLRLRYTANITNETNLPANFLVAVSLHLAILLASRWLPTQSKVQALEMKAQEALRLALRQDAANASAARYDDLDAQGDWVTEALR